MEFKYWKDNNKTYIKAIPENENEKFGYRAEGPYPRIEMVGDTVEFDYVVNNIHPDILGLLCIVCFYPYCKGDVIMPLPVSENFRDAFGKNGLKQKEIIDGKHRISNTINIININKNQKPYKGTELAVSYGGGMDSTALYPLFPDALFINEQTMLPNRTIVKDKTVDNIKHFNENGGNFISFYNTNRRGVSKPSGWATWTACTANTLLLATDKNIGYILTGTVLSGLFLWNGFKYHPSDEKINEWVNLFKKIGIPLIQATGGLTGINNAKILMENNLIEKSTWCTLDDGNNCHKCWKCFNRDIIFNYLKYKKYEDKYWDRYNTEKIKNELNKKTLNSLHILKKVLPKLSHIKWIPDVTRNIPDSSDFVETFHEPALNLAPVEIRDFMRERISKYVDIKTSKDIFNWDINNIR